MLNANRAVIMNIENDNYMLKHRNNLYEMRMGIGPLYADVDSLNANDTQLATRLEKLAEKMKCAPIYHMKQINTIGNGPMFVVDIAKSQSQSIDLHLCMFV